MRRPRCSSVKAQIDYRVNIDEDAINMIQFQHAWQGAAKFINYIDEMLAVLLNIGYR